MVGVRWAIEQGSNVHADDAAEMASGQQWARLGRQVGMRSHAALVPVCASVLAAPLHQHRGRLLWQQQPHTAVAAVSVLLLRGQCTASACL